MSFCIIVIINNNILILTLTSNSVFTFYSSGELDEKLQQIYVWSKDMFSSSYNNLKMDPKLDKTDSWNTLVAACNTISWSVVEDSGKFSL